MEVKEGKKSGWQSTKRGLAREVEMATLGITVPNKNSKI